MEIHVVKDPKRWNEIVDRSPYSVLHHKYEMCSSRKNALPLIFQREKSYLLFPLQIRKLFSFKIASSPIYYYASLLPDDAKAIRFIPETLELVVRFLRGFGFDLLTTSVPAFLSGAYTRTLNLWFKTKGAQSEHIYAHMINVKGKTFEDVWKNDFHKHARNRVRKAEEKGVHVGRVKNIHEWINDIVRCNISSLKRQGRMATSHYCDKKTFLEYLCRHKRTLGDYFQVYGAFYENRLIAYMSAIEFNKLVMITSAMSHSGYFPMCPNNALLAYVIKHACETPFNWVYYSFDRVSRYQDKASLLPSLRKFKFEHGFREIPIPIYHLALSKAGKIAQKLLSASTYAFVGSASLPQGLREVLERLYHRYSKSERAKAFLFS
ncbi:MAG: hypothetical protein E3J73_06545 [Candidatus Bathyarchaeum sp.]|nr:MAG: hypothetical protein E3J73_06545 [Candidatus Bathyarchaeum sp.]